MQAENFEQTLLFAFNNLASSCRSNSSFRILKSWLSYDTKLQKCTVKTPRINWIGLEEDQISIRTFQQRSARAPQWWPCTSPAQRPAHPPACPPWKETIKKTPFKMEKKSPPPFAASGRISQQTQRGPRPASAWRSGSWSAPCRSSPSGWPSPQPP